MAFMARTHRGYWPSGNSGLRKQLAALCLLPVAFVLCSFSSFPCSAAEEPAQKGPAAQEEEPGQSSRESSDDEVEPADGEKAPAADASADDAQPAADAPSAAEKPADAVPPDGPEKDPAGSPARNPFDVGAQLLRDLKAKQDKQDKKDAAPPTPPPKLPELPVIKMTGVMILGDNKMATAEIESYGTITVVKGDRFVLRLKNRQEPFQFTVTDIEERQMTILTDDGTEIRAVFK